MTATQERREKYWKKFNDYLKKNKSFLRSKPTVLTEQWHTIKLGKRVHIEVVVNKNGNRVELYFTDNKDKNKQRFNLLERDYKALSTKDISTDIRWEAMIDKKLSKVFLEKKHNDFEEESKWEEQFNWLMVNAEKMHEFFEPKLNELEKNSIA